MIKKLMTNSRVTEVDAISMRMLGAYQTTALNTDSHLVFMFNSLELLSTVLTLAINRIKADSILEVKDESRDKEVRALFYLTMGFMHHPDPAIEAAAALVYKVIDHYGLTITGENYSTKSSLITSMFDDLSKQKIQDAIALLSGCAKIITALQTAQNEFESTRIVWEQEKAKESTQQNATNIKKEIVTLINEKIVIYLRAMEIVDEATYGDFARTLAQIIADNNIVVKKRRKKDDKPEEEKAEE